MGGAFHAAGVLRVDELSAPGDASSLVQSDDRPPSLHLPVIDLAPALAPVQAPAGSCNGQAGRAEVVSAMLSAAKDWGFFQVVNHGVPVERLEKMVSLARDFFCLPSEQKERGCGYSSYPIQEGVVIEGISLNSLLAEPRTEEFASSVWPGGNPAFCETVVEVARKLDDLKSHILELLAEGMGLPPSFFTRPFEELKAAGKANAGAQLRVNYYPPLATAATQLHTAINNHTDPTLTTLLYQDSGSGLHVLGKDDTTWHFVEYIRGGLVFNVGDTLQGWSNGVLQAGIHRAVLNCNRSRISFLITSTPPRDMVLQPATLPSSEDGDSKCVHYKPFTFRELYASLTNGHTHVDEKGRKGIKYIFMAD